MTGRVEGKTALVSGAARGQGRAHAVRLAEEGANIVAFDICAPVRSQGNPPSTPEDLAETERLVAALGRKVLTRVVDARDEAALARLVDDAVATFGQLDIVVANHGITGVAGPAHETTEQSWRDVLDNNLTGVWNVARAGIRSMRDRGIPGSVIMTSSAAGIKAVPNMAAYVAAKHAMIGVMKVLAHEYAADGIRVNTVNPTAVSTPMIHNDNTYKIFRPDLENPTAEDTVEPFMGQNLLKIPWVEPEDVANGVLFLASDEARYVTGITLPIDAGNIIK